MAETITVTLPEVVYLSVATQGPAGRDGASADLPYFTTGEALGGHRMVVLIDDKLYYADQSNISHMGLVRGMTLGAASTGASIQIQTSGVLTEPSWNYTPNLPLYLGTNGLITTIPPSSGFVLEIGQTISATKIFLQTGQALLKG